MKDVMIDLETFGKRSNAVIIQIGACYFDRYTGEIGDKFFTNIDAQSCLDLGFEVDASTIYWWFEQSKEAQGALFQSRKDIHQGILALKYFIKDAKCIWNHLTFDWNILKNYFIKLKYEDDMNFRKGRDLRTIVDVAQEINPDFDYKAFERVGIHHNSLDDCIYQVKYVSECFKIIKGLMWNYPI